MKKGTRLIDNSTEEYLFGNAIKELLEDTAYSEVSIATGYWDLPGMAALYEQLCSFLERENSSLRILLGEEPSVKAYQV